MRLLHFAILFGGGGVILVMLMLFAIMFIHITITAKIFGKKLSLVEVRTGLIMELPPYHKPKWKSLFHSTLPFCAKLLLLMRLAGR